jgi:cell fate (sporulation/competence/biofilm development) regulator YmcA (YheA/YmcA/DUF963 family)
MRIDESLDNLLSTIKNSDIYKNYIHILDQVKDNADINTTVKEIKTIQKRIVNDSHRGKDIHPLENELESKNKFLNSIPLYQDYIESSTQLNNLIKNVTDKMQAYINGLDI